MKYIFIYVWKCLQFFLLYISIKNKTSVFYYALPFSHGPRRGVSGRGDLCDFTHGLTRLRQPSSGSRRPLEGEQSCFCLCQSSQFSRVSETKEISWWRIHVYISAANHGSVNFSEHRKSSNLDLKQGFSWLHVLNWSSLSEWTYT